MISRGGEKRAEKSPRFARLKRGAIALVGLIIYQRTE